VAIVLIGDDAADLRVGDLIDAEQFGIIAGVKRMTIHAYKKKPDRYHLPEPVVYFAGVPAWTREQAETWLASRSRGRWPESA
jgi:hypothetical protein